MASPEAAGSGKSTLEDIRQRLEEMKTLAAEKEEARKGKLAKVVQEAADLAEGNKELKLKVDGAALPKGYADIEQGLAVKKQDHSRKFDQIRAEEAKFGQDIKELRGTLQKELATAPEGEKEAVRALLTELDTTEKDAQAARDRELGLTNQAYQQADETLKRSTADHQRFVGEQKAASKNPEEFATENVLAAHKEYGEGDTGFTSEEVVPGVRKEISYRGYREQAEKELVDTKEAIATIQSKLDGLSREANEAEQNANAALLKIEQVLNNRERNETINQHWQTIETYNQARFFTGGKEVKAGLAKSALKVIRMEIEQELNEPLRTYHNARAQIQEIISELDGYGGNKKLKTALLMARSAEPTGHPFYLFSMKEYKGDKDPDFVAMLARHEANKKAYEEMQRLWNSVKSLAKDSSVALAAKYVGIGEKQDQTFRTIDTAVSSRPYR